MAKRKTDFDKEMKWKMFVEKMNSEGSWSDIEEIEDSAYDKAIESVQKEGYSVEESREEDIQLNSRTYQSVYSDEVDKYADYSWKELPSWVRVAVKEHEWFIPDTKPKKTKRKGAKLM
jgi:hypothetical protein